MTSNLENICKQTCDLSRDVGRFIKEESIRFNKSFVEHKGFNDLVSYVDREAEKQLVDGLQKLIPGAGFLTEENTATLTGKKYTWIIDPLDGTTNFIHGVPCYCISIGLMREDILVLGVIYEINQHECFYAWEGGKPYLNGKEIHVSNTGKLQNSLLVTGEPYAEYVRMKEYMHIFDHCMKHSHGLRRMGSAAAHLAYVACGRVEGFYEYGLNAWDVAGGIFIIQQAGGRVSDFSGGENYIFGKEIIACNSNMFEEFLKVVKEKFGNTV